MREMMSFGAGVNTVALTILLVNEGWRGPIVFADTGGEWPETYCYMAYFEEEFLAPRGLAIIRLQPTGEMPMTQYYEPRFDCSVEEWSLRKGIIPLIFARWCTRDFKITPLNRFQRVRSMRKVLIGIDAGEAHRVRPVSYHRYPLVERGIDRAGCKEIITRSGLDMPPRSSCFFCPFQRMQRWKDLLHFHPDLFERASEMERVASKRANKKATLHPKGKFSLDEMKERLEAQMELPGFEYEHLREFQGCLCGL